MTSVSTIYIQRLIQNDSVNRMKDDLSNLIQNCPEHERSKYEEANAGFMELFEKYVSDAHSAIIWDDIEPLPEGSLLDYNSYFEPERSRIRELLNKLVVIKLNGGLGTTMKCDGPKSLIPVRNNLTFLDLTVQQLENLNEEFETNIPLVLMNSFNTEEQTQNMLSKFKNLKLEIHTFLQNRYPRMYSDSLTLVPTSYSDMDDKAWYPPGHGNFYKAFYRSGLIPMFKKEGKEYCFISNIDNLGAIVDCRILQLMTNSTEFIMEVTNKTPADVKGGTLIQYRDKLKLLEVAEIPKDKVEEFKCNRKFDYFNTNNLWIKLDAITNLVEENKLSFDIIENKKQIFKDDSKVEIIQLETASGAAIQLFENAAGLLVPRSRFLPVKRTSDLFLLRSNIYVNDDGKLVMNPLRPFANVPLVSLAEEHFGDYRALDQRFKSIPNCLDLHHLTISGNVYFDKDVILKGNVTIVANNGERLDIPQGAVLQYKIATGSLRIVDF